MVGVNPKFQMHDCADRAMPPGTPTRLHSLRFQFLRFQFLRVQAPRVQAFRWRWIIVASLFLPLSFVLVQCGKAPSAGMLAANAQDASDSFEDRFPKPA